MKGQILHLDQRTGEGVIRGEDGRRYGFAAADLRGSGEIAAPGVAVDFETAPGERAREIYPDPGQPRPATATGEKSRVTAGILAILLGALGVHKFYLGYTGAGLAMLACTLLGWMLLFIPTWIVGIIALVEGVIYLTRSDAEFERLYLAGRRPWF